MRGGGGGCVVWLPWPQGEAWSCLPTPAGPCWLPSSGARFWCWPKIFFFKWVCLHSYRRRTDCSLQRRCRIYPEWRLPPLLLHPLSFKRRHSALASRRHPLSADCSSSSSSSSSWKGGGGVESLLSCWKRRSDRPAPGNTQKRHVRSRI